MSTTKGIFVWVAMMIPPFAFYVLLERLLTNIPFLDDYDSVLAYLLRCKKESGLNHFVEIVTSQHAEYRLMFENAIFGVRSALLGHANIDALSILV